MSWKSMTFLLPMVNRVSGWELDGPSGSEKAVNSHGKWRFNVHGCIRIITTLKMFFCCLHRALLAESDIILHASMSMTYVLSLYVN